MSKKIPWEIIQKRYLAGEKPSDICDDYGLTSKQIRDKAHRDKWATEKATILDEIATEVRQEVKAEIKNTVTLASSILGKMLNNIDKELSNTSDKPINISLFTDPYHKIALREGIKHYHRLEILAAKNKPPDDPNGNNAANQKDLSQMSDSELDRLIKDS